jgi:hypothetical protein
MCGRSMVDLLRGAIDKAGIREIDKELHPQGACCREPDGTRR